MKSTTLFTAANVEQFVSFALAFREGNEVWCFIRGIIQNVKRPPIFQMSMPENFLHKIEYVIWLWGL
jgi:hypothetical protein